MAQRLLACALGIACVLAILFLVALQSRGADFDSDWLLEDLTCEELVEGYNFNLTLLQDVYAYWQGCIAYADSPADNGYGLLHCALIKQHGQFLQGQSNAIADVFNAKECSPYTGEE
jgi:hypothetical protein